MSETGVTSETGEKGVRSKTREKTIKSQNRGTSFVLEFLSSPVVPFSHVPHVSRRDRGGEARV